ncbi:MAG: rhodanese-like domain-containing protein [Ignavibacteriae bacterium]|nr:MAG: rhodanese-like domain-containing protein [Ignavibacteriota bacterium]
MDFLLYIVIAVILFFTLKKMLLTRSIKHYSPVDASQKLKRENNTVLLDVRTSLERKKKSIKGSFHIPLQEINSRASELKKFKDKEIICYCRTGSRSLSAASKLKKHGFSVANLKGGILQWNAVGLR